MGYFEDKTPATMELHTNKFLETNNFAYAMSAFCRARSNGDPIPEVILETIEKAFLEWGKHNGEEPLDKILGIKAGKGNKSALGKIWTEQRNTKLFKIMVILIGLKWSTEDAAAGACAWLNAQFEANPIEHESLKPSNAGRRERNSETLLDSKTLVDYWNNSKYKKQRKEAEKKALMPLILWSNEDKEDYEKYILKLMGITEVVKKKISSQEYIKKLIA